MDVLIGREFEHRLHEHSREWGIVVERTIQTETSFIAYGARSVFGPRKGVVNANDETHSQSVVLKVVKHAGDEWRAGEVLKAFDGRGVVRVYDHAPGAVLMERLRPGTPLVDLVLNGKDEEATDVLASAIQQMFGPESARQMKSEIRNPTPDTGYLTPDTRYLTPDTRYLTPGTRHPQTPFPTVHDWARGFDRYIASGDEQIPRDLVESAQQLYMKLAATQRQPRLLHGDLQHYNVLYDSERGWVAIDPKGVIGEVEYEIGAAMRNPVERPDLFLSRKIIERRLEQFTARLNLDYKRALAWTFAQAVLSAIWVVEDEHALDPMNPSLMLANTIRPLITR